MTMVTFAKISRTLLKMTTKQDLLCHVNHLFMCRYVASLSAGYKLMRVAFPHFGVVSVWIEKNFSSLYLDYRLWLKEDLLRPFQQKTDFLVERPLINMINLVFCYMRIHTKMFWDESL